MSDNALKRLTAEIDKLQAEIVAMQSCPPISETLPATAQFLSKTNEPWKRDRTDTNPWVGGGEACIIT